MNTDTIYLTKILDEIFPPQKEAGIDPFITIANSRVSRSLEFQDGRMQERLLLSGIGEYSALPSWEPIYKKIQCEFLFARASESPDKSAEVETGKGLYGVVSAYKGEEAPLLAAESLVSDQIFSHICNFLNESVHRMPNTLFFKFSVRRVPELEHHFAVTDFSFRYLQSEGEER